MGRHGSLRRLTAFRLHSRHTHRREIRTCLTLTASATRKGYLGRLRLLTRDDVRSRLAELRPPTLFVAAEDDRLVPSVVQARYMAARVPGSSLRILPGHGHICRIAPGVDLAQILDEWRRPNPN